MPLHILGISGSLRKDSYNTAALRAAKELLPEGVTMDLFKLTNIPKYDDDTRAEEGFPAPVMELRRRITEADALLIATPEYNFSFPGVLKNAIDWASRTDAHGHMPMNWKPIAILGATTGMFGTVRAQMHLRQVFVYTNSFVVNKPEVLIAFAKEKFDNRGRLTDEVSRGFLRELLASLVDLTQRLAKPQPAATT